MDISKVRAGRELDAEIAIAISLNPDYDWRYIATHPGSIGYRHLPCFSSQSGMALDAVESLGCSFQLRRLSKRSWQAALGSEPTAQWKNASSPALAICRALLAFKEASNA